MSSGQSQATKLVLAVALFGLAGFLGWRWLQNDSGVSETAFFYDLSEGKLFVADRGSIPPVRGLDDAIEDGVRAVVVSTNGRPEIKVSRVIAYLETCTPELKAQLTAAKAAGTPPEISRTAAQSLRLVKRVSDSEWVSLASPEGERIVNEWLSLGTAEEPPAICTP